MAKLNLAGTLYDVTRLDGGRLRIGDAVVEAEFHAAADGSAVVTVDGRQHRVRVARSQDQVWVHAAGRDWAVERVEAVETAARGGAAPDEMRAAMPGTVVAVAVETGAAVTAGETIMVIESMKLETTVAAPRDGVVAGIGFDPGATFAKGAVLARLAPAGQEGVADPE